MKPFRHLYRYLKFLLLQIFGEWYYKCSECLNWRPSVLLSFFSLFFKISSKKLWKKRKRVFHKNSFDKLIWKWFSWSKIQKWLTYEIIDIDGIFLCAQVYVSKHLINYHCCQFSLQTGLPKIVIVVKTVIKRWFRNIYQES